MPATAQLRLPTSANPIELSGTFGELCFAADRSVALHEGPAIESAVVRAMHEPVGLPPLSRCFTQDDQIAVALGAGVPQVDSVLRGVLTGLAEANIEPRQVTIVTATVEPTLATGLADAVDAGLRIERHDPADEDNLCFAGVDDRDEPLRINRRLFEADVILPVTCGHAPGHPAAHGAYGDVYPTFGDAAALRRLAKTNSRPTHDSDAERAGWVLGALLALQVVPGPRGGVAQVFAGEAHEVDREAARCCQQAWAARVDSPTSLVVITLATDPERQTWGTLATALDAASPLVAANGAIAVVTQLAAAPPQALIELADADDPDHALHRLRSKNDPDLLIATSMAAALQRGPLYLLSGLSDDDVESLGMTPLCSAAESSAAELQRLVASRPSVLLLEDAEHVVATLAAEVVSA